MTSIGQPKVRGRPREQVMGQQHAFSGRRPVLKRRVEQVTKFRLSINLKIANALG